MRPFLRDLLAGFAAGRSGGITREEALALAELPWSENMDLIAAAGAVRAMLGPAGTGLCAIMNAKSGRCPENCAFCAQSARHRTGAPEYPLVSAGEMAAAARAAEAGGAARFGLVTSGTRLSRRDLERICAAARRIREECRIGICVSAGLLGAEELALLREAGVTRIHHNPETARSFFPRICTTHDYEEDIAALRLAKAAGMETCGCGIFGMGESWAQRIELLETVRDLDVDSVPVNFLNPVPGTPLGDRTPPAPREALRTVALARLMMPAKDILICGGRLAALGAEQSWVLAAGASALLTGDYLTTRGRGYDADRATLDALGGRAR